MEEKQYLSTNSNATTVSSSSSPKSIFGTADRLIWKEESLHLDLVDFKFGYGEVDEADINIQGLAYAIGAIDIYPEAETVTIHFIIPRRDELLKHEFSRGEIDGARERVRLIIDRALSDNEELLSPNAEACKYCGVRATCKALADKVLPIAKKYAEGAEAFEISLYKDLDPSNIEDPNTLNKMMHIAAVVDNWGKAVRKESLRRAVEEGTNFPDFDLQHRRPSFSFKGEEMLEVFESLKNLLSPEEFAAACKTTLAELSKAVKSKLPRGEKMTARGQVESTLLQAGLLPEDDEQSMTPYLRRKRNLK